MYSVKNIPEKILKEIDDEYGNIFYGEITIKKNGYYPVDISYTRTKRHKETEEREREYRNG